MMAAPEPGMEDILASLRRILMEDEDQDQRKSNQPALIDHSRSGDDEDALMREWAAMAGEDDDDDDDDDDSSAEWEAMLGGQDDTGDDEYTDEEIAARLDLARVLNQDEIDSLLGFDSDTSQQSENVLDTILHRNLVSYEQLPMLAYIMTSVFVKKMELSMREFYDSCIEISVDNMLSMRFGDYLNSIPLPAMIDIFDSKELEGKGLIVLDSSLIYSTTDVLLGGRRGTAAMRIEGRPYTRIEKELVFDCCNEVLKILSESFEIIEKITFDNEKIETNPRYASIAEPSDAIIVIKTRFDMDDRGGRLEIVLPYFTIERLLPFLRKQYGGKHSNHWNNILNQTIPKLDVDISVETKQHLISLDNVLKLKVGDTFVFSHDENDFQLKVSGKDFGSGKLCKQDENYAIQIQGLNENE